MTKCIICGSENTEVIYENPSVPVMANKIYKTEDSAKKSLLGKMRLVRCADEGGVNSFSMHLLSLKRLHMMRHIIIPRVIRRCFRGMRMMLSIL